MHQAFQVSYDDSVPNTSSLTAELSRNNDATIQYSDEYRRRYFQSKNSFQGSNSLMADRNVEVDIEDKVAYCDNADDYDDMENSIPKYLIFSTGSKTYTPHQIGIKRVRHVTFPKKMDPGPSLKERIAARKAAQRQVNHCSNCNSSISFN